MSCFESSIFLQNAALMDRSLLIAACEKLGWQAQERGPEIWITPPQARQSFLQAINEPILRLRGNTVTWNTYYYQQGKQDVQQLQAVYDQLQKEMRVEYARTAILTEFKRVGFHFLDDLHFRPTEQEKHRFFMKGESKLKDETERVAKIRFTILEDGTVRTDSDYIPEDIHRLADDAMAALEAAFSNPRKISPKEIPAKYLHKAFCHRKDVIQLRQGKK